MGDGSWKSGGITGGLDVDISVETKPVNIKEGDIGGGDGPGELDRVATVEVLKEKKRIIAMSP